MDTKRKITACKYCRGRKIKCNGEVPCDNCTSTVFEREISDMKLECVPEPPKKRGPKSGSRKRVKEENNDMKEELTKNMINFTLPSHSDDHFVDMYFQYHHPLCGLLDNQLTAETIKTLHAKTNVPAMRLRYYAILVVGAQLSHDFNRVSEYLALARNLSSQFYDEPNECAACAYGLLASYYIGIGDITKASLNLSLAINMARLLKMNDEFWSYIQLIDHVGFRMLGTTAPPISPLKISVYTTKAKAMCLIVSAALKATSG